LPETRLARPGNSFSMRTKRRKSDRIPWPGALILAIATACVLVGNGRLLPVRSSPFSPLASDRHGRVEIHWDPQAAAVRKAESAMLDAVDDGTMSRYPVERKILRDGAIAYVRHGQDVALTITLYENGRAGERASILSISPVMTAQ
jgi:hypothetical protein